MKLPRRRFLHVAASAAALSVVSRVVRAQAYPSRPLTLMVFVPAGGTPDIIARLLGQSLSHRFGQSVVIDNRPGGGGNSRYRRSHALLPTATRSFLSPPRTSSM